MSPYESLINPGAQETSHSFSKGGREGGCLASVIQISLRLCPAQDCTALSPTDTQREGLVPSFYLPQEPKQKLKKKSIAPSTPEGGFLAEPLPELLLLGVKGCAPLAEESDFICLQRGHLLPHSGGHLLCVLPLLWKLL